MDTKVFSSTCEEHQKTKAVGINSMNTEWRAEHSFFPWIAKFLQVSISLTQFQQVLSAVQVSLSAETCAAVKKSLRAYNSF